MRYSGSNGDVQERIEGFSILILWCPAKRMLQITMPVVSKRMKGDGEKRRGEGKRGEERKRGESGSILMKRRSLHCGKRNCGRLPRPNSQVGGSMSSPTRYNKEKKRKKKEKMRERRHLPFVQDFSYSMLWEGVQARDLPLCSSRG